LLNSTWQKNTAENSIVFLFLQFLVVHSKCRNYKYYPYYSGIANTVYYCWRHKACQRSSDAFFNCHKLHQSARYFSG